MEDLSIKVPKGALQGVVDAHVRAAVSEALGRDPSKLVNAVVSTAMRQRNEDRYGRTGNTIFEDAINSQIREVANEEFRSWLDDNRSLITARVRGLLDEKGIADVLAKKLTKAFEDGFQVSISLRYTD